MSKTNSELREFFSSNHKITKKLQAWRAIDNSRREQEKSKIKDDPLINLINNFKDLDQHATINEGQKLIKEIVDQRKHRISFSVYSSSKIRLRELNVAHETLLDVWRYCLTDVEKFYLWFMGFNSMERVRLWNRLVFSREWFNKAVTYSKEQVRQKLDS